MYEEERLNLLGKALVALLVAERDCKNAEEKRLIQAEILKVKWQESDAFDAKCRADQERRAMRGDRLAYLLCSARNPLRFPPT